MQPPQVYCHAPKLWGMPAKILDAEQGLEFAVRACEELLDKHNSPVVLIDGSAGSGKTHFAKALSERIFQSQRQLPKLIQMDDIYPGWDGLRAGAQYLNQHILTPITQGQAASWQIWDWGNNQRGAPTEPANGWRSFEGGNLVIVEGCGSISKAARDLAQLCIWVESDAPTRKQRYSDRDDGIFDEFYLAWSIQEDEFYQAESSQELADLIISN